MAWYFCTRPCMCPIMRRISDSVRIAASFELRCWRLAPRLEPGQKALIGVAQRRAVLTVFPARFYNMMLDPAHGVFEQPPTLVCDMRGHLVNALVECGHQLSS